VSILNRPSDGLLSVLLALRRGLAAFGPQTETRLLELCAPASVVPDGKPDLARKTLMRWKQMGFFRQNDGLIHLSSAIGEIAADDLDGLRAAVLRLVLAPENNPALTSDTINDDEGSKASDCTRAAAWVLAQDPYSFPSKYRGGVESLQDVQGVDPRAFANDTRWAGFAEWAVFLGLGWTAARIGFVPAPAFAVSAVLNDAFADATETGLESFLTRIAEVLPVFDGGRYRLAVESQIARPWHAARPNRISPSLSAALLSLEAKGSIRMETRSDAQQWPLLGRGGRELHAVSHVVRLGVP
jgi:hypothetical protein